ncbi:helix-turn-helix transcriptional regulator [Marinobacter mobilis]|uniref:AraC-type DNA-binding protein n=1 Tax=Marinobacter mobilis TaxID=488533 RepID=A0A1H2QZI7_9GAMM|nr:helix-turn-helix transcriptional regulator [Marinobacter mobilis]SDW12567.1 AraC-type DNA-binding protein [Marinobacter mobilis]
MAADDLANLMEAMQKYLHSEGYSQQQLDSVVTPERVAQPPGHGSLSLAQLQALWLLIQRQLSSTLAISLRVRPLILAQLERGRVGVELIASQLNMSRYTLYKRLKAENQTFAGIFQEVRREQALVFLQDPQRPLVEVAERLGFSELSAFSRAFKRWMGCSPAEYRAHPGAI